MSYEGTKLHSATPCLSDMHFRGATTAEESRGTNTRALASRDGQRPDRVLGAGGGRPSHSEGPGVSPPAPGKFLKTQMLNPAFW